MEYKQADFCRAYNIEVSTVSKAIKRGALVKNAAGLLDDEHTLNKVFLAKYRVKSTNEALADDGKNLERVVKKIDFESFGEYELAEHAGLPKQLLNMSIRDLVIKFKGMDGLERYIKMLRDLAAADEKDQKTQERRLQLVEKDFMIARVFQYLDDLMKRLLEWPTGAATGIIAIIMSKGEEAQLDVIHELEKEVSNIIKDAKQQVIKELSGLRAKYQEDDKIDEIKAAIEEVIDN